MTYLVFRSAALTLVASLALAGTASAQQTDWSGFYLGLQGGYALDNDGASGSAIGPGALDIGGFLLEGLYATDATRLETLFGTVSAGYNFQHESVVLGAELGLTLGDFSERQRSTLNLAYDDGVDTITASLAQSLDYDISWISTVQGRIGVTFGDSLVFVKAGVAVADTAFRASSALAVNSPTVPLDLALDGATSGADLIAGPALGVGIQHRVTENIAIGAEYGYIGLPDVEVPLPGILGGGGTTTITNTHHVVRAGISFHF